jgi:hypothetical protein
MCRMAYFFYRLEKLYFSMLPLAYLSAGLRKLATSEEVRRVPLSCEPMNSGPQGNLLPWPVALACI